MANYFSNSLTTRFHYLSFSLFLSLLPTFVRIPYCMSSPHDHTSSTPRRSARHQQHTPLPTPTSTTTPAHQHQPQQPPPPPTESATRKRSRHGRLPSGDLIRHLNRSPSPVSSESAEEQDNLGEEEASPGGVKRKRTRTLTTPLQSSVLHALLAKVR